MHACLLSTGTIENRTCIPPPTYTNLSSKKTVRDPTLIFSEDVQNPFSTNWKFFQIFKKSSWGQSQGQKFNFWKFEFKDTY